MALFQSSVLKKYLKSLDEKAINKLYKKYTSYFHSPKIQENIRNSKEEQFQEGFLRELFVNIFGYVLNPSPNFNLTTELKNIRGAKKVDGAILNDNKALAVIELKGVNTKDLEKVRQQAFDYKANQSGCVYVITSNFEKLRFYIDDAVEHIEFNLFTLSEYDFTILYLCLNSNSLLKNIPLKIKAESIIEEEGISKKFYSDYSLFKRELYRDLVKNNISNDVFRSELKKNDAVRATKNIKLSLFSKSQKLIDRFLFILFAEDRGLLSPNTVFEIINDWEKLAELDAEVPLYDRFKLFFTYLDTGRTGTDKKEEVFAYNGGLFKLDSILDSLIISDEVLNKHTKKLSAYDFESQVDVNILGHIFENSLNEIESVNAEIEGGAFDKQKAKRKKDGVFYTPKYVTKYIVDNSIGKICLNKRMEFGVKESEYLKNKKGRKKETLIKYKKNLDNYRNWLLSVTICDPACGSGAFLNQVLDFLIREHSYIDDLEASLLGGGIVFQNIENSILENNIYGVDINEESVDIAKLSLWLRTAQPRRKLTNLNNNIKCGNSLIESKSVAKDKAFNWESEFPSVFENGGFDVVIGNPPYVNINTLSKDIHDYFVKNYGLIHTGYNDLMYYFLYKGIKLLNDNGVFGVITSNYFIGNEYAKQLRCFLSDHVTEILNFNDYLVFDDASVHTAILFLENKPINNDVKYSSLNTNNEKLLNIDKYRFDNFLKNRKELQEYWVFASGDKSTIIDKLASSSTFLGDFVKIEKGSTSGKNDVFTVSSETANELNLEEQLLRKNVKNGDIVRYGIQDRETYLIYTDKNTEINNYPNIFNYLLSNKDLLEERNEVKKGLYDWWRLERPRKKEIYDSHEKIIVPYRASNNRFAYDDKQRFNDGGDIRVLVLSDKSISLYYILGLLNSKLLNWYYGFIGKPKGNSREYFNEPLARIPIRLADKSTQGAIAKLANAITDKSNDIYKINRKFISYVSSKFNIKVPSKNLQKWHEFDFSIFIKELNKAIKKTDGKKLSKIDEIDWMDSFDVMKNKIQIIQKEIDNADSEIDRLVYKLYDLTDEDILIIEN